MIKKSARFEKKLCELENAIDVLWKRRDTKSENSVLADLFSDESADLILSQIIRALAGSSPVLGNELVCANLDKDDIAELHQRLFAMKRRIEEFYEYFKPEYVRPIDNSMFSFYTWFVVWANLPEVPPDVVQPA